MKYIESKFSVPDATPRNEICTCTDREYLLVMYSLGFNPIHCIGCNLEIDPATLLLPDLTVDALYYWNHLYAAIERLWLDSDEYESWAAEAQTNIFGRVNVLGLEATNLLNKQYSTLYSIRVKQSSSLPPTCPGCGNSMENRRFREFERFICQSCHLTTTLNGFEDAV